MKRQHGILLSWAAAMVIVLSACVLPTPAPIATATPAPAASQTPTEPVVPTAAPTPATEPTIIRIATAYGLELPDPALANPWNEASSAVLQAVYQTLVTYVPDEFATIAPGLAQRWEVSDDYKTLTFHLREDARFADGDPVTAKDVVFSFERLKGTGGAPAFLAETIASVEAVDDDTVVLKLTQQDPAILPKLATQAFSVVNEKSFAGSGPYVVASQTSDAIVLKPNPYFPFDDEFTKFDEVVLRYVPDSGEQLALLRAGEIDIALDLTAQQAGPLKGSAEFSVYEDSTADLVLLAANLKHPGPAQNPDVQAAIRYALDYQSIRDLLAGGAQTPASFIPQGFPEALSEGGIPYDPEKAKDLLKKAGYQGEEIRLGYQPSGYMQALAEVIAANLTAVGLNIQLVATETPGQPADFDLVLLGKPPSYLDAQDYLGILPGGKLAEAIGWQQDVLAQVRVDALQEVDPAKRKELLTFGQQKTNEIGPYAFVVQPGRVSATRLDLVFNRDGRGVMNILSVQSTSRYCKRCCQKPPGTCCNNCACC